MRLLTGTATTGDLDAALADLTAVGDRLECTLQAFDARYVADPEHLRRAVTLADRARARGESIARERAVEVLLYAAGRRQITRALTMGLREGETPAVVLAVADPPDADGAGEGARDGELPVHETRPDGDAGEDGASGDEAGARERAALTAVADLSWFEPAPVALGDPERLRDFFEVSQTELAATDADLADLVHERVALLVVDR